MCSAVDVVTVLPPMGLVSSSVSIAHFATQFLPPLLPPGVSSLRRDDVCVILFVCHPPDRAELRSTAFASCVGGVVSADSFHSSKSDTLMGRGLVALDTIFGCLYALKASYGLNDFM